jgi:hypothetical protein
MGIILWYDNPPDADIVPVVSSLQMVKMEDIKYSPDELACG